MINNLNNLIDSIHDCTSQEDLNDFDNSCYLKCHNVIQFNILTFNVKKKSSIIFDCEPNNISIVGKFSY